MTSRIGKIAPLVIAALCFARCVLGQAPPSGTYSNSFSDLLSVWDVSGAYDEDVLGGDLVGNCTISQDAQGKITGTGSASYSNSDYGITVDMDFTVKGKEITINTNQLYFTVPELNVWHIVYQHKGKPILEMGRGVKNGLKIHRMQAIRLGLEMWNGSRKMNKLKLKQLKEADKQAHSRSSNE